jgi:hypothetical protein
MGEDAKLEKTSGLTGLLHLITGAANHAVSEEPAKP